MPAVGMCSIHQLVFESRQPHLCNSMWGQDRLRTGHQEVGKCSTRGGSWGTYITFASTMLIRQPTLALKPRGDVIRNPKQGYQWPQKWTCVHQKLLKKIHQLVLMCNSTIVFCTFEYLYEPLLN